MKSMVRRQPFGTTKIWSAVLALGIAGAIVVGVATYTFILDDTDDQTTDIRSGLPVTTDQTAEEWFFEEQNWNMDSPPPGQIDANQGEHAPQLWEDTRSLEWNTIFQPGNSDHLLPYTDRTNGNY